MRKAIAELLRDHGLELHPDKTRVIEFGRFAREDRARRGLTASCDEMDHLATYPAWVNQPVQSFAEMALRAASSASTSASAARAFATRSTDFILLHASSIGFSSGEYGGRNSMRAPRLLTALATSGAL